MTRLFGRLGSQGRPMPSEALRSAQSSAGQVQHPLSQCAAEEGIGVTLSEHCPSTLELSEVFMDAADSFLESLSDAQGFWRWFHRLLGPQFNSIAIVNAVVSDDEGTATAKAPTQKPEGMNPMNLPDSCVNRKYFCP